MEIKRSAKLHGLFISLFFSTLFFGDIASHLQTQLPQVGLYFIGYALSLILIEKRFNTSDFLLKQTTVDSSVKEKIFVSGEEIETEVENDVEENRFFRVVDQKNMINKKLFLIVYAALVYFAVKTSNGNFQIASILPFITAIMIVFSATIGHLLIALFFNALYFTMHAKSTPLPFIVIYLSLFLLTLIIFTMTSSHTEIKNTNKQLFLRNLLGGLIPLISIIFVVNHFISKPLDMFSYKQAREFNKKAGAMAEKSKDIARKTARELNLSIPTFSNESSKNTQTSNSELAKILSTSQSLQKSKIPKDLPPINFKLSQGQSIKRNVSIDKTKELVEKMEQSPEVSEADIEKLKEQLKNLKFDLSSVQNSNSEDKTTSSLSASNNMKNNETKKLEEIISMMEKEIDNIKTNPDQKLNSLKNIQDSLETHSSSTALENHKAESSASKEAPFDSNNKIVTGARTSNNQQKVQDLKKMPNRPTPPLIDEKLLKFLFNIFSAVVIIGVILFILNFIHKFFKKTEYKDLETIIDKKEEEAAIKSELNSLKKRKLAPKEEIILYYEVLYKILKLYHYPDHEAPPPMAVYDQVKAKHVSIQKQLYNVTEIFCRSFYGNHPVTRDHLIHFRKSLLPILINFGFKKKLF